jgi:cytosine/adenosine deaminase-related metal-dependent hydrolase
LQGSYESLNAGVTTIVEHASGTFSRETAEAGLNAALDAKGRMYWAYAFHELGKEGWGVKEQMEHWRELKRGFEGNGRVEFGVAYDGFGSDPRETVEEVVKLIRYLSFSTRNV